MRSLRVSNIDERLVTRCGRLPDPLAVYSRSRRKRRKPDRGLLVKPDCPGFSGTRSGCEITYVGCARIPAEENERSAS
jgi:hypothetical protein